MVSMSLNFRVGKCKLQIMVIKRLKIVFKGENIILIVHKSKRNLLPLTGEAFGPRISTPLLP